MHAYIKENSIVKWLFW